LQSCAPELLIVHAPELLIVHAPELLIVHAPELLILRRPRAADCARACYPEYKEHSFGTDTFHLLRRTSGAAK
jgi:hypothetical protein